MTDDERHTKDALLRDLEQTVHAARHLVRDTMELTQAAAATTWHFTRILADAAARTTQQAAREAVRTTGSNDDLTQRASSARRVDDGCESSKRWDEATAVGKTRADRSGGNADADLRLHGDRLLSRSADVRARPGPHPAYERILCDLAPDEARILRFLALNGNQPSVDVRTSRPLGIGSEKTGEGLSMIGELAGCSHVERTHAYFNNLNRLGLVWFSKEAVEPQRYQVVEVQPAVLEAARKAGRAARIVRRSIKLTPFGEDLCRTCFTLNAD